MFSYLVLDKESSMPVPCYRSVQAIGCPMPDAYLNGRPVYFGDATFDGVDSFFESASYADTGTDLDYNELDQLQEECQDYLVEGSIEAHGYYKK